MKNSQKIIFLFVAIITSSKMNAMFTGKIKTTKHVTFNEDKNTVYRPQQYVIETD